MNIITCVNHAVLFLHTGVPGGVPYPFDVNALALIFAGVVFIFNSKSPRGESTALLGVPLL